MKTRWYDAAQIAQRVGLTIETVKWHWRRSYHDLDLPPAAVGFIDEARANRLCEHILAKRRKRHHRRGNHYLNR